MAKIADLIVSLSADIASFRSGMQEANSYLADTRARAQEANDTLSELTRVVEAVVSVEAVDRVSDFVSNLANAGAQIGITARELGMGAEEFQALSVVAEQAGSSQEAFRTGMDHLAKSVSAFASGASGPASDAFRKLQISVFDAQGGILPLDEILPQVAAKLETVSSATERLALEQEIFGRGGAQLDQTLRDLADQGADQATQKMKDLGLVLSDQTIKAAQDMSNEFKDLSTVIKNQLITSVVQLEPEMKSLATYIENAAKGSDVGNLVDQYNEVTRAVEATKTAMASGGNVYAPTSSFPFLKKVDLTSQLKEQLAQQASLKSQIESNVDIPNAPAASPKPPFADPAAQKNLANFQQQYKDLLNSYGVDLDYQERLKDAYQQGSAAVAQLTAQKAGEAAVEKMLADAQKAGVQVTGEQVQSTFNAAASAQQATTAADNQKAATAALASQQTQYQQKLQQVLAASDGLSKKNNELADDLAILDQQVADGAMSLTEYATRAKALQDNIGGADASAKQAADQVASAVERGASAFLSASAAALTGKNAMQGFGQAGLGLVADLAKIIEQIEILEPLEKALRADLNAPVSTGSSASPTLGGVITGILGWLGLGSGASSDAATNAAYSDLADTGALDPLLGAFAGFQQGGSFDVGGNGSPDSKLVAFMATPGEHVQVGDQGGRGGGGVNVNIVNNHPSAQVSQQSEKNSNGGTDIVVQIEDAMAARYRRGQGNMRRAIEQSHSLNQTPIQR